MTQAKQRIKDKVIDELETLPRYSNLPNLLKTQILNAYNKLKAEIESKFNELRITKDLSSGELLNEIIYEHEMVDDTILKVGRHALKIDNELIDDGYNTEVYTTNKRLILLNATSNNYPEMLSKLEIKHTITESFKEFSIPNKDIRSINVDMRNKVVGTSIIRKFSMWWLAIVGIAMFILGTYITPSLVVLWIIVAVLLIIVAYLVKSYSATEGRRGTQITRIIQLAVVEPFYGRRALLTFNVSDEHSVNDIISWIKKLQNRI